MDTAYPGNDIIEISNVEDYMKCQVICALSLECAVFTYIDDPHHDRYQNCYIKNGGALENPIFRENSVSGRKSCFKGKPY